ncbi:hypothetical protein KAS08_05200 [Candidatus Pacearchaeota archaeon]|nr:hypothetical protein [Candidatus Pacearchaeota archaeon]
MVENKKNYQKIVDELVRKSFPELKKNKIFISEASKWVSKYFSAAVTYVFLFSILKISKKMRDYSEEIIESVLAHELGHIVGFKSYGFFGYTWRGFRYLTFRGARTIEENVADKIAIDRGYAKGLYEFKNKYGHPEKYKECYMSAKEVKEYAKSVKKW